MARRGDALMAVVLPAACVQLATESDETGAVIVVQPGMVHLKVESSRRRPSEESSAGRSRATSSAETSMDAAKTMAQAI